jgi:DNA-binding LacI/PurR family transcriptional regulator
MIGVPQRAAGPITLVELGRMLDLDKSTVSLALRGSERIAPETRRRVAEMAERMGYRPNLAARQLKRQGSPAFIGLYLPTSLETLLTGIAVRTIQELARLAAADGLLFQILTSSAPSPTAGGLRPDAALVWGDTPMAEAGDLLGSGRRALVIDPNHPSYASYDGPAVRLDNPALGTEVARLLAERGAKRLLVAQVLPEHLGHQQRWVAARAEWVRHRPLPSVSLCQLDELDDRRLAEFAAQRDGAIFCTNDRGALSVWRRLQRIGARMPDDVRLVGVNGEAFARTIGLTTALFDSEGLARAAYAAAISGEAPSEPISFTIAPGETA